MNFYRLFIAIRPPQNFIDELVNYQKTTLKSPIFRLTPPQNLHLTLIFLGAIREEQLPIIQQSCNLASQQTPPFLIEFSEFCYGPNPKNPRLVWLKGMPNKNLSIIINSIRSTLQVSGIILKEEYREFQPHITISRLKLDATNNFSELPSIQKKVDLKFIANSLLLMQSYLKTSGAEYQEMQQYQFTDKTN